MRIRIEREGRHDHVREVIGKSLLAPAAAGILLTFFGFFAPSSSLPVLVLRLVGPVIVVIFVHQWIRFRRRETLYEELDRVGLLIEGHVTKISVCTQVKHTGMALALHFRARSPRGESFEGKDRIWDEPILQAISERRVRANTTVQIRIHPDNPSVYRIVSVDADDGIQPAADIRPLTFRRAHCLIPIAVGLGFVLFSWMEMPPELLLRRLKTSLLPTMVTSGRVLESPSSHPAHKRGNPTYRIQFEYVVGTTTYRSEDRVDSPSLGSLFRGEETEIVCLTGSPSIAVMVNEFPFFPLLLLLGGILGLSFGLAMALGWLKPSPMRVTRRMVFRELSRPKQVLMIISPLVILGGFALSFWYQGQRALREADRMVARQRAWQG